MITKFFSFKKCLIILFTVLSLTGSTLSDYETLPKLNANLIEKMNLAKLDVKNVSQKLILSTSSQTEHGSLGDNSSPLKNQINTIRNLQSDFSTEEQNQIQTLAKIFEIGNKAATISCALTLGIGATNPAIVFLPANIKFWPYIKYMKIQYPKKLQFMLESLGSDLVSYNFGPSMPSEDVRRFTVSPTSNSFERYHQFSSFIINYWPVAVSLTIIFVIIIGSSLFTYYTQQYKIINKISQGINLILRWNLFLMIFCSNIDVLISSTSLQLRMDVSQSFEIILNLVFCIAINILFLYVIGVGFYAITDIWNTNKPKISISLSDQNAINTSKVTNDPKVEWTELQIFFRGLKDNLFSQQVFLVVSLIRIFAYNLIISFLFEHPLAQSVLISVLGYLMLVYVIWKRPFSSKFVVCHYILNETANLIINTCLIILASSDNNSGETSLRVTLGDIIAYSIIIFMLLNNLFLITYIINGLLILYQIAKSDSQKGIVSLLNALVKRLEIENTKSHTVQPIESRHLILPSYTRNQSSVALNMTEQTIENFAMARNQSTLMNNSTTVSNTNMPVQLISNLKRRIKHQQSEIEIRKGSLESNDEEILSSERRLRDSL